MLPFLLLSHRPEDEAAHAEHHSFRRIMGLRSEELVQVRMNLEQPELDFADYSGIILGGGDDQSGVWGEAGVYHGVVDAGGGEGSFVGGDAGTI